MGASYPSDKKIHQGHQSSNDRFCEGFRMTAHRDGSACTGAVVRKPPVKERAGDEVAMVMPGYGDLIAVLAGDARRESMAVS
jgi:hypothetical protein